MNVLGSFNWRDIPCLVLQPEGVGHLCGYVGLPAGHGFHGVSYQDQLPLTVPEDTQRGKRGILPIMLFSVTEWVRLDILIDVHGSVTFSKFASNLDEAAYVDQDSIGPRWWIGFDCGHLGDIPEICTVEYVTQECRNLVDQLNEWAAKLPEGWVPTSGVDPAEEELTHAEEGVTDGESRVNEQPPVYEHWKLVKRSVTIRFVK